MKRAEQKSKAPHRRKPAHQAPIHRGSSGVMPSFSVEGNSRGQTHTPSFYTPRLQRGKAVQCDRNRNRNSSWPSWKIRAAIAHVGISTQPPRPRRATHGRNRQENTL
ncbi:hypothetical protein EYF80_058501 [Liparis tanakae]|uniref:Uncharacterized protein n=1 Tax=Liparis tanakae TaxID=230148 RepID=A0A4Z2ERC8_9TELE|nr:hypothetical protein EYF80_058501 [Liparis tanakae]